MLFNLQIFSGCVCHLEQLHAQSPFPFPIVFSINTYIVCTRQNGRWDKFRCYHRCHNRGRSSDNFENLDFRSCLMIDLGRETNGNNQISLSVCFALCIIKALRLICLEHCSWDACHPLFSSFLHCIKHVFFWSPPCSFLQGNQLTSLPNRLFAWKGPDDSLTNL